MQKDRSSDEAHAPRQSKPPSDNHAYTPLQSKPYDERRGTAFSVVERLRSIQSMEGLRSIPSMITRAAGYSRSVFIFYSVDGTSVLREVKLCSQHYECSIGKSGKCLLRIETDDVANEHATLIFDPRTGRVSVKVTDERKHVYISCIVEDRSKCCTRIEKKDGLNLLPKASAVLFGHRSWVTVLPNPIDVLLLKSKQGHTAYCSDLQPRCIVGRASREANNALPSGNQIEIDVEAAERHHFCVRRVSNVFILQDLNTKAGTYLNNLRMHPQARAVLFPGARIYIGSPKDCNYITVDFVELGGLGISPELGTRRMTRIRRKSSPSVKRRKMEGLRQSKKVSPELF